jgi:peptidoglycan/xylan/chitin deacetylase (PgdA/CDA1 family)
MEGAVLTVPFSDYVALRSVEGEWSDGLLVLMYHSVAVPPVLHGLRGLYVTPQLLTRQIRELQAAPGTEFTTLGEWNQNRPATRRVSITFDDAYRNLFTNGIPVLRKTGVRALTYVVGSLIGKTNEWDADKGARREPLMNRAELTEWIKAGHEIGSHGLTHRPLTVLSLDEVRREIFDSKKLLEDLFGQPVHHFCYPYGDENKRVRDLVKEAGYQTATCVNPGFNFAETNSFNLRRYLARHEKPYLAALFRR